MTTGQTPLHSSSSVEGCNSAVASPLSDHLQYNKSDFNSNAQEGSDNFDDFHGRNITSHSSMASTYTDVSSGAPISIPDSHMSYQEVCVSFSTHFLCDTLEFPNTCSGYLTCCKCSFTGSLICITRLNNCDLSYKLHLLCIIELVKI